MKIKAWKINFYTIWFGQQLSSIGTRVVQFAIVWWLTKETGSAMVLATGSIVTLLPNLIIRPFQGVIIDRYNRKTIMITANIIVILITIMLIFVFLKNHRNLLLIYIFIMLRSLSNNLHISTLLSSTSLLVPKNKLTKIAGLEQTTGGLLKFSVPIIAAFLIELYSLQFILYCDILTNIIAIGTICFTKIPQQNISNIFYNKSSYFGEIKYGFEYLFRQRKIFKLIIFVAIINLTTNPAFNLLPIYVYKYLKGNVTHLGYLNSSLGFGIIAGGLLLNIYSFKNNIFNFVSLATVGAGFTILVFAIMPISLFFISVMSIFIFGIFSSIFNGIYTAILQGEIPTHLQGRIFNISGLVCNIATPLGLLGAGFFVERFDIDLFYIISAIICISLGLIFYVIMNFYSIIDFIKNKHIFLTGT